MHIELKQRSHYLEGAPVSTIYFGGGTPSLLSADDINRLIETVHQNFNVPNLIECTMEANPDDLTVQYLRQLRSTSINRLSIGVQSFKEQDLQYMGRAHTAVQADYAIKAAQDAGFPDLSIDLIYGTPGLSDREWKANLHKVRELQIPHFSSYALTVEEKTALHSDIRSKKKSPVHPEQAAEQFGILEEFASTNCFDHYEISNLALPGRYAVHNTSYWLGLPYLGAGPSAHSFNGVSRRANVCNNAGYITSINDSGDSTHETELLSVTDQVNEYVMTSIRTIWGCDTDLVARKWGPEYQEDLLKKSIEIEQRGHLLNEGAVLQLTTHGKLFADRIASDLFF